MHPMSNVFQELKYAYATPHRLSNLAIWGCRTPNENHWVLQEALQYKECDEYSEQNDNSVIYNMKQNNNNKQIYESCCNPRNRLTILWRYIDLKR